MDNELVLLEDKSMADRWQTYKHFKLGEFKCKCGGVYDGKAQTLSRKVGEGVQTLVLDRGFKCQSMISLKLVGMLDRAREIAKVPFAITSAFRCRAHNFLSGGVGDSQHLLGLAVDIAATGGNRVIIANALREAGFKRFGWGKTFIHVDLRSWGEFYYGDTDSSYRA